MRGKWLLAGGTVVLLAVAAGALSVWWRDIKPRPSPVKAAAPAVFEGPEVSLSGRIQAHNVVPVAAPFEGLLDTWFVEIGQEVYEGQLLGRIRSARLDAEQEQALAEVEKAQTRVNNLDAANIAARLETSRASADAVRARSEFERTEKVFLRQQLLMREGATPRLVYEKAEREYQAAKADWEALDAVAKQAEERTATLLKDLDTARRSLAEKTEEMERVKTDVAAGELHSPVDGLVIARRGQPGENVHPSMTDLVQIAVELGSLEVLLEPEPPVLARLRPGQQAAVRVAEHPEDLPGVVREIRRTQVVVDFRSPTPAIKPGLTAQVRIKLT